MHASWKILRLATLVAGVSVTCATAAVAQSAVAPQSSAHTAAKTTAKTSTKAGAKTGAHTAKKPAQAATHSKAKTAKAKPRTTPVVSPRHHGVDKKPVHPEAKLAEPAPKAAPKPVPKPAAPAKPALPPDEGPVTHLHLPRFASLKTDDVNMRRGPGSRYPVLWTYKRRDLPVKIEREFDVWRLVEDMDGVKGWVHQATLTGKRSFVVMGDQPQAMRESADPQSAAVAMLKPGVVGRIKSCDANADWCQVQVAGYRGWLPRSVFWGTDTGEAVAP